MNPAEFTHRRDGGNLARILTDGSKEALVEAIEQNCIDFFMDYGRGPGGEVHREDGVTWFTSGLRHPLFNGVMTAQLPAQDVDRRIDDLVREFRARDVPLEWTVGTSTVPRDLGRRLEAKGLGHLLRVPGMAVPLADVPPGEPPEGLRIRPARGRAELETAMEIALTTFEIPVEFAPRLAALEEAMPGDHRDATQAFLGWYRGKPVASSVLFTSAGVAGVYFVGTMPEVRRRGFGGALTAAALGEGRRRGFRFGALQATSMGVSVYRRLGFRAYSEFEIYT